MPRLYLPWNEKPIPSRPAKDGPVILTVRGISDVPLAPGPGPIIKYRWPKNCKVAAWIVLPRSGLKADANLLRLRMQDNTGHEFTTDTENQEAVSPFLAVGPALGRAPFFSLAGWDWSPNWAPLERVVRPGNLWELQLFNSGPAPITPFFGFGIEDIELRAYEPSQSDQP